MRPADFLDDEPLMLYGCTGSELTVVIFLSIILWAAIASLVSFIFWNIFYGLLLFMTLTPTTVWALALASKRLKQDRPRRWHLQYLAHQFHSSGYFKHCQHRGLFKASTF